MQLNLTHLRLLVEDYAACFRFYRDVMGFEPAWGDENSGYADFEAGGAKIAVFGRQAMAEAVGRGRLPSGADVQDRAAMVFEVPSVDRAAADLAERGVTLDTQPLDMSDWGVRVAHFRDPDGNLIEINQPLGRE